MCLKNAVIICVIVSLLVTGGCTSRRTLASVGQIDRTTGEAVVVSGVLRKTFDDGLPISNVRIEHWQRGYMLLRQGSDGQRSRVSATELNADSNGALYLRVAGVTETCSGNPCS